MPACLDEAKGKSAELIEKHAASVFPKRSPERGKIELAPLDSREAFVLSSIDGKVSLQQLVDIAAMSPTELADILDRLVGLRLVTLDDD